MCIIWVGVQKERINRKVILNRPESEQMEAIKTNQLHILEEPFY